MPGSLIDLTRPSTWHSVPVWFDLAMQIGVASVCGVLTVRDEIWAESGPGLRLTLFVAWLGGPLAVISARSFAAGTLTIDPWYLYGIGMAALLIATSGRPSLIMNEIWPEAMRSDESLDAAAAKRVLIFFALFLSGIVLAYALGWELLEISE